MGRYIVGITGASGMAYAEHVLRLLAADGHKLIVTVTEAGHLVMEHEFGRALPPMEDEAAMTAALSQIAGGGRLRYYANSRVDAPIASGSVKADAMIVVPCTVATVSALATGASRNLLERAADVMLKERRTLVLAPRETPFSPIHLQNMLTLSQCGAVIAPACPAFYQKPESIAELVENFAERLLVLAGAREAPAHPWEGM